MIRLSYTIDYKTIRARKASSLPKGLPTSCRVQEWCVAEDQWPRLGTYLYVDCPDEQTARAYHKVMKAWSVRHKKTITCFDCEMEVEAVRLS